MEKTDLTLKFMDVAIDPLPNLSFEIQPQETFSFLGLEKSDRSLLIDLASGLRAPDSGRVTFFKTELSSINEEKKNPLRGKMGIVTYPPVFLNNVRIMENMRLPLRYHSDLSTKEIDDILFSIMDDLKLKKFTDAIPSGFDPLFLGIASLIRGLSVSPKLLILERPIECLGKKIALSLPIILSKYVFNRGGAVLILSSNTKLVSALSNKLGIIEKGKLSVYDSQDDILKVTNKRSTKSWDTNDQVN